VPPPSGGGIAPETVTQLLGTVLSAVRAKVMREREREMAKKSSGKKGAAVLALIAVLAFVGAPQAASAASGKASAPAPAVTVSYLAPELASWWEEASWAES
jgi:hypothetical protein